MRFLRLTIYVAFAAAIVSCASSGEVTQQQQQQQTDGGSSGQVLQLIADVPAANQAENEWLYGKLAALGPSGIHSLADMLAPAGNGNDSRARYGLNGVTKYVSREAAQTERAMVERTLLDEIQSDHHASVNVFLMEQLELIGSDESVPVLQSFIGDDRLNESAVHALRSINSDQSRQALADALNTTEGEKRVAVIKALGDLEVASVAPDLLPVVSSDDQQTRNAALYALAQSGHPDAEEALSGALETSGEYQKIEAERYYLLYARRLAEEGHTEQSTSISRDILSGSFPSDAR